MPRVLIVEDELTLNHCLQDFFRLKGCTTLSAYSGEEAVERLKTQAVDAIILDVVLPGLSGIEVLRQAKIHVPHAKIIVVTAVDDREVFETIQRCGVDAVISKPFDFSDPAWSHVFAQLPTAPA